MDQCEMHEMFISYLGNEVKYLRDKAHWNGDKISSLQQENAYLRRALTIFRKKCSAELVEQIDNEVSRQEGARNSSQNMEVNTRNDQRTPIS